MYVLCTHIASSSASGPLAVACDLHSFRRRLFVCLISILRYDSLTFDDWNLCVCSILNSFVLPLFTRCLMVKNVGKNAGQSISFRVWKILNERQGQKRKIGKSIKIWPPWNLRIFNDVLRIFSTSLCKNTPFVLRKLTYAAADDKKTIDKTADGTTSESEKRERKIGSGWSWISMTSISFSVKCYNCCWYSESLNIIGNVQCQVFFSRTTVVSWISTFFLLNF